MEMFKIEKPADLLERVRNGNTNINVSVYGYWSSSAISIYVSRDFNFYRDKDEVVPQWKFSITHSSGGRDTSVVPSDLIAEFNFGHALIAATQYAAELQARADEFEAVYQEQRELNRLEDEEAKAKKKAAYDADIELGDQVAKGLINDAVTSLKELPGYGRKIEIQFMERGSEHRVVKIVVILRENISFTHNGERVSKKVAIEKLANASTRKANWNEN